MPLGPTTVIDEFRSFPGGMNAGVDPSELPKGQLAMLVNGTVRGSFVTDRPPHHFLSITGAFDGTGLYQGACYYKPDYGPEQIVAQIGGKVFAFTPGFNTADSAYIAIPGGDNPSDLTGGPFQAWLWQAERWVIGNDGQSTPWFYDGQVCKRSGLTKQIATIQANVSGLTVGTPVNVALTAYPSGGAYGGPYSVPVYILDPNTGKSSGEFELLQVSSGGGTAPTLAAQTNHGTVSLPSGTQLQIRTPIGAWSASVSATVSAGPWSAVTTSFVSSTDPHCAIPLSVPYPAGGAVGDVLHFDKANVNLMINGISPDRMTVFIDASPTGYNGVTLYAKNGVTGITHTFKPTTISLPLSSAFPGAVGSNLYLTSGQYANSAFAVVSVSGTSVVIDVSAFSGSIAAGTSVTNVLNPGYSTTVVGTLQATATLSGTTASNIVLSPTYAGTGITVYDSVFGYTYTLASAVQNVTTTIQLLPISLNSGVTSVVAQSQVILANQLPVGRMGSYVLGRSFISMPDGVTFICSDATGESSGSLTYKFRDAVLFANDINELTAGTFSVPGGTSGRIAFIAPNNQLDASLGQGPVQIGTPTGVFSCNLPADSTQWQTTTAPLLTQTVIGGGAAGQWSAVNSNDDLFYRGSDGSIRSLKLSRQEFANWGQVPCSQEVQSILAADDKSLLQWCSGCNFDNRLLMTTGLVKGPVGVYGTKTAVINFDRISSLAGKAPSVYDGIWDGLNVLQYVTGTFNGVPRCFAFCYDTVLAKITLWELLPSAPKPQTGPLTEYQSKDTNSGTYSFGAKLGYSYRNQGATLNDGSPVKVVGGTANPALLRSQTSAAIQPNATLVVDLLAPAKFTVPLTGPGNRIYFVNRSPQEFLIITGVYQTWYYLQGWRIRVYAFNSSLNTIGLNENELVQVGAGGLTYTDADILNGLVEYPFAGSEVNISLRSAWTPGDSIVTIQGTSFMLTSAYATVNAGALAPVTWRFETGRLLAEAAPAYPGGTNKRGNQLAALTSGELYLKDIQGDIAITVYFRPDYSWSWQQWRSWTIPYQPNGASFCRVVGLGEPPKSSDSTTKRPWREGYHFQLAVEITGHCTVMGGRIYGEVLPTPAFAPLNPVT